MTVNISSIIRDVIVIFWWKIKFIFIRALWRSKNKHNKTELVRVISPHQFDKIKIWNYTYWPLDIRLNDIDNAYIEIWNYCSIAPDVTFICWLDHRTTHFSTYPFLLMSSDKKTKEIREIISREWLKKIKNYENKSKWPIIVADDVRIWTWAKIMSWVSIWQWAVVWAYSLVTKDIPAYSIVWGIPAKIIRYRFSKEIINKLLQIDYKNIPIEKFIYIYEQTIRDDFDIDFILKNVIN